MFSFRQSEVDCRHCSAPRRQVRSQWSNSPGTVGRRDRLLHSPYHHQVHQDLQGQPAAWTGSAHTLAQTCVQTLLLRPGCICACPARTLARGAAADEVVVVVVEDADDACGGGVDDAVAVDDVNVGADGRGWLLPLLDAAGQTSNRHRPTQLIVVGMKAV